MQITNRTHWRTDHLKAIIQRVSLTALEGYAKRKKRLTIEIVYSQKNNHSGCAVLGGTRMTLRIPKGEVDKPQFAWLVDHEMGHIRGQEHRQMSKPELYWSLNPGDMNDARCTSDINEPKYAWAASMPLEPKRTPSNHIADPQRVRYQSTLESIARAEALLPQMNRNSPQAKAARTRLRKLKDRKYYYEKEVFAGRLQVAQK